MRLSLYPHQQRQPQPRQAMGLRRSDRGGKETKESRNQRGETGAQDSTPTRNNTTNRNNYTVRELRRSGELPAAPKLQHKERKKKK
ncbi:hypothetical protein SOVF_024500 [Spinacia oleracea]|nr:hypothetical protein SOVF_024500 [Spinacia oleracea]